MIRKIAFFLVLAFSAAAIPSSADAWGWRTGCSGGCGHNPIFPLFSCRMHGGYPCVSCWRPYNAWSTRPGCGPGGCGAGYAGYGAACGPYCNPYFGGRGHGHAGNAFSPAGCAGPTGCANGSCMAAPVMADPMQMAQYFDPSLVPYMNRETLVDANSGQPVPQDVQPVAYWPAYGMQPYQAPYAIPQYPAPYASPYAMPYGYQAYPSYWYGN